MRRSVRSPLRYWRSLLFLALLALLAFTGNEVSDFLSGTLALDIRPRNEDMIHRMIMLAAIVYAALIAIPFVPGVEIALTLIAILGPAIVLLLYFSTLAGLLLAFGTGRLVPTDALVRLLDEARFRKAGNLLREIEPLDPKGRFDLLVSRAPNRMVPLFLRHRYLALAILLNVPGNILIGGGGGIAMLAGASRLYSFSGFICTIALAIAPIPLLVLTFGADIVARWA